MSRSVTEMYSRALKNVSKAPFLTSVFPLHPKMLAAYYFTLHLIRLSDGLNYSIFYSLSTLHGIDVKPILIFLKQPLIVVLFVKPVMTFF